jgi:hypothetical protein
MYLQILSEEQNEMLDFVAKFKSRFYLVGGTAIALQLGHRTSIDFDLFSEKPFSVATIHKKVSTLFPKNRILYKSDDQIHYIINGVKFTFFYYPYMVDHTIKLGKVVTMPDLLTLAAMKAFALGRRAKWKDYVDLFFILKSFFSVGEVADKAKELFQGSYNSKLFRQQLAYFDDINYDEEVFFFPGYEVPEEEIKSFLIDVATEAF